jgi:putative transposase
MTTRTVRTFEATIPNQQQVRDDLDELGWAASKLWNVGRYYAQGVWDDMGEIPDDGDLKRELKGHERYTDLHSQSSQRVLEELAEAFNGWFAKRRNGDDRARPPGYRKRGDSHPRSTVSFKAAGFKHDAQYQRVRLSKGRNLKEHRSDFVLCEYEIRPDVDLTEWDIQQVRAVHKRGEWRLQFVCRTTIDPEPPGDRTAGVDLGISNIAAVSFGDETLLFPGGWLKESKHYYKRVEYECEGENGLSRRARNAKRTLKDRRKHFHHTLSKHIVAECVERGVGRLMVGDLGGIRSEDDGSGRNWGRHGNKMLHGWGFGLLTTMLEYKGEAAGIEVVVDSEHDTSKTCAVCGHKNGSQRVERGLYHCQQCGRMANADANGAENIRQTLLPNPDAFDRLDRDNGCLAQPAVCSFDATDGRFHPQERAHCEP